MISEGSLSSGISCCLMGVLDPIVASDTSVALPLSAISSFVRLRKKPIVYIDDLCLLRSATHAGGSQCIYDGSEVVGFMGGI